jgi:GTP 3',8-cyclase
MVSITSKPTTTRTAIATCSVHFSNPSAASLIRSNSNKKGDVLGVARIAGIMAAKRTAELIPLCHPIMLTFVGVDVNVIGNEVEETGAEAKVTEGREKEKEAPVDSIPWAGTGQGDAYRWPEPSDDESKVQKPNPGLNGNGRVDIRATVTTNSQTGVEMEALTAASTAALTVYDMCKAVDKSMRIEGLRVIRKEGGRSRTYIAN